MSALRALAVVAVFLLAACAQQGTTAEAPKWRLISATEAADESHLIVTIELEGRQALAQAAQRLEADYPIKLVAEWPLESIDVHCLVFRAEEGSDLVGLERRLNEDEGVRTVQRMRQFSVLGRRYADEHFTLQHSLAEINAVKVHRFATGMNVRVGVVDTGVDGSHPDLARQLETSRDFVGDRAGRGSKELHGTAVAGVIAADATNGTGIVGVAPDARILALRGCWQEDGTGRCSSFSLARALNFAILNRVDVLNLSLAGPRDPLLEELVNAALTRGIVIVAAYGETSSNAFPAALEGIIAVASTRSTSAWPSSQSPPLPAPGLDVITTVPDGGYDFFSGSSVAAAHVSGIAALLLERDPSLTPKELQVALARGVREDPAGGGGAVLDACRAIATVPGAKQVGPC